MPSYIILRYTRGYDVTGDPWTIVSDDFYITINNLLKFKEENFHFIIGDNRVTEEIYCHIYQVSCKEEEIYEKCWRPYKKSEIHVTTYQTIKDKYNLLLNQTININIKESCHCKKECMCYIELYESLDKNHIYNPCKSEYPNVIYRY